MAQPSRAVPLTAPGPLWSQREYVACMKMGIQFAAHRCGVRHQAFHYGFPQDIPCTTVIVGVDGVVEYIDHDFTLGPNWISLASSAIRRNE